MIKIHVNQNPKSQLGHPKYIDKNPIGNMNHLQK